MTAYSHAQLAYRSTANHGRVAAANPHGLISLLMDGAVERIARARGCIDNKDYVSKSQLLHRAIAIVDELRSSLNTEGGELANNLNELYGYMCRLLLQATVDNDVKKLDQVLALFHQIRGAWLEIPNSLAARLPRVSP